MLSVAASMPLTRSTAHCLVAGPRRGGHRNDTREIGDRPKQGGGALPHAMLQAISACCTLHLSRHMLTHTATEMCLDSGAMWHVHLTPNTHARAHIYTHTHCSVCTHRLSSCHSQQHRTLLTSGLCPNKSCPER